MANLKERIFGKKESRDIEEQEIFSILGKLPEDTIVSVDYYNWAPRVSDKEKCNPEKAKQIIDQLSEYIYLPKTFFGLIETTTRGERKSVKIHGASYRTEGKFLGRTLYGHIFNRYTLKYKL